MKTFRSLLQALVVVSLASAGGCASLVSGRYADVRLDSNPPNAHVVVRDHKGVEVAQAQTPAVVTLKRKREYFMPARYTATFEAPGYETAQVPIRSTLNWWSAGNIIFGGLIGAGVDTATGAAWKPKEDHIVQNLSPIYGGQPTPAFAGQGQPGQYVAEQVPMSSGVQPVSGTY